MASPSAGVPALKYGDVNTVTSSPGEVKGLRIKLSSNKYSFTQHFNILNSMFLKWYLKK